MVVRITDESEDKLDTDNGIVIRSARNADSEQIAKIYEKQFSEHILVHLGQLNNKNYIEKVISDENTYFIVAERNGEVLGAAALAVADIIKGGEIERVVVSEEFRGNGLSKKLCSNLVDKAKELGLQYVFAYARGGMKPMQKCFKSIGFKVYGVMPIFAIVHEGEVVREQFVHMGLLLDEKSVYDNAQLIDEAKELYKKINDIKK